MSRIPTTEEVRMYATSDDFGAALFRDEFDRWLAEHDRELSEKRWDEGSRARHEAYMNDSEGFEPVNPYREESK